MLGPEMDGDGYDSGSAVCYTISANQLNHFLVFGFRIATTRPHPRHAHASYPAFPVRPRLRALVSTTFIPHAHGG